jgi:hypothetical protein
MTFKMLLDAIGLGGRVARFFSVQNTKTGKNTQNIYQIAVK